MQGFVMNELQALLRLLQTPAGKMLWNGAKDFGTNHLIPYLQQNIIGGMKPVTMSTEEQTQRASTEFMTVDDFDIKGDIPPKTDDNNNGNGL